MADAFFVEPVMRFCAVISSDAKVRSRAIERLVADWGQLACHSEPLPFHGGGYYADSMGDDLRKELIAFGPPIDGGGLADWKHHTNEIEKEVAGPDYPEIRPLNLDPGYVTQAKLVLATTKNRDHRVYLRDGMFGEITLNYMAKKWTHHRWTYPDYRTEKVAEFAMQCRNVLRDWLIREGQFRSRGVK